MAKKKVFELYSKDVPCTYSMTINLDITGLKNKIEIKQLKFFPVILYGLSKFVNKYKEFRMDLNEDGELGYYDKINPIFTLGERTWIWLRIQRKRRKHLWVKTLLI